MVFTQIFDLSFLVDELALLVLHFLLGNDPVIINLLPLLLEVGQQLLLLVVGLLQLPQLLPHGQLQISSPNTLNSSDSVSLTFLA